MANYLEETKHGKIYTSCFDSVLGVRKINPKATFVVPHRGSSWKKFVPNNSRSVKVTDFDIRKELAPSRRLADSIKRKLLSVEEYEMTYALEMEEGKCAKSITELANMSLEGRTLVIFGLASRGRPCHRYMLGKLVARAVRKNSNSRHRAKFKAYAGELTP